MKNLALILTLIFTTTFYSQSGTNGLFKFRLQTDFKEFAEELSFISENASKVKTYRYLLQDIPEYYGIAVEGISLEFYKEKLATINLYLSQASPEAEQIAFEHVKTDYGPNTDTFTDAGVAFSYVWQTQDFLLYYTKNDISIPGGENKLRIHMLSVPLHEEIMNAAGE